MFSKPQQNKKKCEHVLKMYFVFYCPTTKKISSKHNVKDLIFQAIQYRLSSLIFSHLVNTFFKLRLGKI